MGNDSTYIKELKQIMKACRNDMSLVNIRNGVANSNHMSSSQRSLAEQNLISLKNISRMEISCNSI